MKMCCSDHVIWEEMLNFSPSGCTCGSIPMFVPPQSYLQPKRTLVLHVECWMLKWLEDSSLAQLKLS